MLNQVGYYAVKFLFDDMPENGKETIRLTNKRVQNPLEAMDNVLGSRYSIPNPMIADILHDFSHVRVKFLSNTIGPLRSDKRRIELIKNPDGWIQPGYPQELVERARKRFQEKLMNYGK